MPTRLFVSYRRSDSAWAANAIHTFLVQRFGAENVFKDLESIIPGQPWQEALESALESCELMLVIIGGKWATCKSNFWGSPRIKQNGDMVRKEISFSLEQDIPVIPVLIDEAQLPGPRVLPHDIKGLRDLQAARINGASFRADLENLIERRGLREKDELDSVKRIESNSREVGSFDDLIMSFLSKFKQWSFSPLRIKKWGGLQTGFEQFSELSTEDIRATLERLRESGVLETRKSQKGNTLYRVTNSGS